MINETTTAVPDALFPSDNAWGIPTLDPAMQARGLTLPLARWGSTGRSKAMRGTYHFYTHDYKFSALWNDPSRLLVSGCEAAVEVNFSTHNLMPRAVVLHDIFRKRWMSRCWQLQGVRIFVDLNVDPEFYEVNLLGVPRGWKSYCTRGYERHATDLIVQYNLASGRACTKDILFVVIGGSHKVKALCAQYGWTWIPEEAQAIQGREVTKSEVCCYG